MKWTFFVGLTVLGTFLTGARPAVAQSFLQRLGEQLNQTLTPRQPELQPAEPPAEPQRAEPQRAEPPVDRDSLPAPRSASGRDRGSAAPLGIRVNPVTDRVIREQKLVVRRGAVITAIEPGSAADRAGLPIGGVIVAVEGRRVDHPDDLAQALQASRPGTDVELIYYDDNRLARKKVHLAAVAPASHVEVPADPPVASVGTPPATTPPAATPRPAPQYTPGLNLEGQLGGSGSRPLLGRLGRVIDNVTAPLPLYSPAPASTPAPVPAPAPAVAPPIADEFVPKRNPELADVVFELQQQVAALTAELDALRKQVTALESRLPDKN